MLGASLILLVSLVSLSYPLRISENVVFEKVQEVSAVRSKWVFSFFTDLRAYHGYMQKLQDNLSKTELIIKEVLKNYNERQAYPYYMTLYYSQKTEIISLRTTFRVALQELQDIKSMQNMHRVKRAVLPFVGRALSFLFGTMTKADLRKIYRNIDVLSANQNQIIHVLNDTLSILNVTNIQVKENRHALRTMGQVIRNLEGRLNNVSDELRRHIAHLNDFLLTYLQIDLMLVELRESVEKAMFYMDNVKMQMNQLSLGHLSPTVIPPGQLRKILTDIQSQIPEHLKLPAPVEDVWYYYKALTCVTLVKDRRFITLVNVPLLELNSRFEVYQVHNIPVPYQKSKMTASYELETGTIAIDLKQTEYAIMSTTDVARCSHPMAQFCTLSSALYSLPESRLCVVSLYRQDQAAIQQNCRTKVRLNTLLPQAINIPDGNWVIVAADPLLFTVMCLNEKSYQIKTQPPVFTLQLPQSCQAFAKDITLPPYYHQESNFGRGLQRDALLTLQNISTFSLWKPLKTLMNATNTDRLTDLGLPDLEEIDNVPIDTLVDRLNNLNQPDKLKSNDFWDYVGYAVFPLVVLCTLVLFWVVIGKRKICKAGVCETICKIRKSSTTLKAGRDGVESVASAESTEGQPREGQVRAVDSEHRRPTPLTVELRSAELGMQ